MTLRRFVHVTDLHVTEGPRLADQAAVLNSICDDVEQLDPAPLGVLLTGDLYGRTVPHRSTPNERAVLFPALVRLAEVCPVVVVAGNHDHGEDLRGLEHLGGRWQVHVATTAGTIQLPGDVTVYTLPYPTKAWLLRGSAVRGVDDVRLEVQKQLGLLLTLWRRRIERRRKRNPDGVHLFAGHVAVGGSKIAGGEVLSANEIELQRYQLETLGADYAALGHLHLHQRITDRAWYGGSPWRSDFGETDGKGWAVIDLVDDRAELSGTLPLEGTYRTAVSGFPAMTTSPGKPGRMVRVATACRRFLTLDYRWADAGDGEPAWVTAPTAAELERVADSELRVRVVVPQQWVSSVPIPELLEQLGALKPHRVKLERTIEPALRVRSNAVAKAATPADKLRAWWGTLATEVQPWEQEAGLEALHELQTEDDEDLAERIDLLIGEVA